ncbi:hypothetical protein GCM10023168_33930 [Fodinibacter luteus]|uniref:Uncharacterized protein n=1 Tax=Fodinibacter luteus TaxID=552064 RepID=A0ABP8KPW9_9MICO
MPVHVSGGSRRQASADHECLGQLGQTHDTIVLEGNGVSYFVTKTHPDLGHVTAPVSLYYEAGSSPTARVFAPDPTQHTSLIITIVGELHAV